MDNIIVKKGYTLKVVSYEGDSKYYMTNHVTVDTIERAKILVKMCKELLSCRYDGIGGIGSLPKHEDSKGNELIRKWVEMNPIILEDGWDEPSYAYCVEDYIVEVQHLLVGVSELYFCRTVESVEVTYCREAIYGEVIDF